MPDALVVSGAAGTGKSTFAVALAGHLGAAVLDLDATYAAVLPLLRPRMDAAERRAALYAGLRDAATPSLAAGTPVLLVAPWTTERRDPDAWAALAAALASTGGTARLLWVCLDPATVLHRLRERRLDRDAAKLAAPGRWLEQARPDEPPVIEHVRVDGARPVAVAARRVAARRVAAAFVLERMGNPPAPPRTVVLPTHLTHPGRGAPARQAVADGDVGA